MAAIRMKTAGEYTGETLDIGQKFQSIVAFNDINKPSNDAPVVRNDFKVNGPAGPSLN